MNAQSGNSVTHTYSNTLYADVHFFAKLGLSVSPDFVASREENGESKWLMIYPVVTIGYRYPIVKDKVCCTISLGTCGVGAGIAITLNDKN